MESKKRRFVEIFKYNAILSILFFIASTYYLSTRIEDYSFSTLTISAMSRFLTEGSLSFFNSMFFVKSILDLTFSYYIIKHFNLKYYSFSALSILIAVLSFGLLGFFPSSGYQNIHIFLVCVIFLFWTLSEYLFARLTGDASFIYLTHNLLLIQLVTGLLFLATNNFNAIFETLYMLFVFIWLTNFITRFLRQPDRHSSGQ